MAKSSKQTSLQRGALLAALICTALPAAHAAATTPDPAPASPVQPGVATDAASDPIGTGTGLKPPTPEELAKVHERRVKHVRANGLAIARHNHEARQKGRPPVDAGAAAKVENEIEIHPTPLPEPAVSAGAGGMHLSSTAVAGTSTSASTSTTNTLVASAPVASVGATGSVSVLPASVDNSTLPAFPPIGNQGHEGSCVAFAATYYQASHETCLARGCNNKLSQATRFSPKWTYNMVNGGVDQGSWFGSIFAIHEHHGAPNLVQLPYRAGDYRAWDMNPADWTSALQYRMNAPTTISGISGGTGMANLKQHLANGHVANIATNVKSWVFDHVTADPGAPSPFAGQVAMTFVNGNAGGHAMTIVGYDDNVWIDLNKNGVVDPGEKGAWKIANSWGAGWKNAGFIWVAYDAMRATTAVAGGPASSTRQPAFWFDDAYIITAKPAYTPRLIAQFTLNHANRGQMTVTAGVSAANWTQPTKLVQVGALQSQGGAYAFDGSLTPVDGTFSLDISDVIPTTTTPTRYYLKVQDSATGNPLTLKSMKLIHVRLNQEFGTNTNLPVISDGNTQYAMVNYTFSDVGTPPVAQIQAAVSPLNGGLNVSFEGGSSFDSDGRIVGYAWDFGDGSLVQTNSTVTHFYGQAGTFKATLTVTDNQGARGVASFPVTVQDVIPPTAPTNLTASVGTSLKYPGPVVNLSWTASTDNFSAVRYEVHRSGKLLSRYYGNAFVDATAVPGTAYSYNVNAIDGAGNRSAVSNTVVITR